MSNSEGETEVSEKIVKGNVKEILSDLFRENKRKWTVRKIYRFTFLE